MSLSSLLSVCVSAADLRNEVLVYSSKNRNRAVHGDAVVVELLPQSEWKGKVTALTEGQVDEKSGEGSNSKPMPTGGNEVSPRLFVFSLTEYPQNGSQQFSERTITICC